MQSVTDNLKASLGRRTPVYKKTVELFRQTWNGSAYAFEADPVDITNQIVDAGRIMWKLDKEAFNSWTLDNTTITVRNDRQQWKQDNPMGYFPSGYVLRGSKVRIKVGAQLADGTYEQPYVFYGYINSDPTSDLKERTCTITLTGAMSIFESFNAEDICTKVEPHPPSSYVIFGQNSGTSFVAGGGIGGGVGRVWGLKRGATYEDAADLIPKIDYTITNLNIKGTGATITLVNALTAGETLYGSYSYWFQDKPLEDIVQRVMTLCGITSYSITPAVYTNSILNLVTYTTEGEWAAAADANISTIRYSGSAVLGDAYLGPVEQGWTYNSGWILSDGTWRPYGVGVNVCTRPTKFMGVFDITTKMGSLIDGTVRTAYLGITDVGNGYVGSGLFFKFKPDGHVWVATGYDTAPNTTHELLDLGLVSPGFSLVSFRMEVDDDVVYFYKQGVLLGSIPASPAISSYQYITLYVEQNNNFDCAVGTINAKYTESGVLTFGSIDTSASVASYGQIAQIQTLPAGTDYLIETRNSNNNSTWSDWLPVLNTGLPAHATVKRYIQLRVTLYADAAGEQSPKLDQLTFKYYTSNTLISLVNLTGLTCKGLLDDLAEKCCYEMGFDATGKFIFRPRSTSLAPVIDLTSGENVLAVRNVENGVDRMFNYVEATFGDYTEIADDSANTDPSYGLRGKKKKYIVGSSPLLPNENVYLATAVVPTILEYVKTARPRCQADAICLPHLELGDIVRLSHEEPGAMKPWVYGDGRARYGDPDLEYYDDTTKAQRITFWKTLMRIEGIELEWWNNWMTILDLVKVI